MKKIFHTIEHYFEKLVTICVTALGHSLTFLAALVFVIFWLFDKNFKYQSRHDLIRDLMYAITFLAFFIIQKSVNRISKAIHIKLNELVTAHDNARNHIANIEEKTEKEMEEIVKKQDKLIDEKAEDKLVP